MTAAAGEGPLESGQQWRFWLIAIVAALLLAGGIFKIQRMPGAQALAPGGAGLTAESGQALALYNLRAAHVLRYDGAIGAGLRVSVSTGRLAPATRRKLFMFGAQLPNVRGAAVEWQGRSPATGRISVLIGNQRQSSDAGMLLDMGESGGNSELHIRAVQTVLTAQIVVLSPLAAAPIFTFGDTNLSDPVLASIPVEIEIPPGETMTLAFDSEPALAGASFRPGELSDSQSGPGGLGIGRAEVGQPAASNSYPRLVSTSEAVCASRAGKVLFTHGLPTADDCGLGKDRAHDSLVATGMAVGAHSVAVKLAGGGFVLKDGNASRAALWPALIANPLIGAVVAALVGAIAWPLWRLWRGRRG